MQPASRARLNKSFGEAVRELQWGHMRQSPQSLEETTGRMLGPEWERLPLHEREVIEAALRRSGPRHPNREIDDRRTFGERAADWIAAFGGSWTFILCFFAWLIFWAVLNTEILGPRDAAFDPYPYIFLNLILSMLAAIQAPIIMMSQNRQTARDRIDAEIDHEVNVRAEVAIRQLGDRLRAIEERVIGLTSDTQRSADAPGEASGSSRDAEPGAAADRGRDRLP